MTDVDPLNILKSADAFATACGLMHAAAKEGKIVIELVFATFEALALELYLKCLIFLDTGQYKRGHDLFKLFKVLPLKTQAELKHAHDEYLSKWPQFVAQAKRSNHPTDLEGLLILGRSSFMDFRYVYETAGTKKRVFGLHGLSVCIRERILKIKPEWEHLAWEYLKEYRPGRGDFA